MNNTIKTSSKQNQLAAARAALSATGKSPRQIGHESRLMVIDWIYRWGYTSAEVIQVLLGRTSGGYLKRLAKQGWLSSTKTKSGIPSVFFTLTEQGLEEAEHRATSLYRYPEIDPYRVDQAKIRHYLIAQLLTANALKAVGVVSYETERMFIGEGEQSVIKRPDVVWITSSSRLAGEIELSAKWSRDLDDFVLSIIRALEPTGNTPAKYSRFFIASDSQAIIDRYRTAMKPGATVHAWTKTERGHWAAGKAINVPDWLIQKVDFQLIER